LRLLLTRRRAHRLGSAIVATLVLTLALPALAPAAPLVGVQGISANQDPAQSATDLDRAKAAHLRVIRVQAVWASLQPNGPDAYDAASLARLDGVINAAAARGIRVVLFADATPCWASASPDRGSCGSDTPQSVYRYPPTDPKDFAAFSAFLVKRYAAKLTAYEVWNEPDQSNELYFAGPDKASRYVAMLKAAYGPVKRAAPKVQVLAGSFVGNNGAWLRAMYKRGIKGYYDGLAVHFYFRPLADLAATRAVQARYHDRKALWLTEFGWSSCYAKGGPAVVSDHVCLTPAGQAAALSYVIRSVARQSWVRAAIAYTIRDEDSAYRFGLFDSRDRAKPAYGTLQRLLARKLGAPPRPTLRLGQAGQHLLISGTGSLADSYAVRVSAGGHPRFRAKFATDRFGRYHFRLPASVPTSGVRVTVASQWSGRSSAASR
jgi:hypothetical protein